VLAGSWTDTGWPDTMEGAVRSGLSAVIALHAGLDRRPGATVNDIVNSSLAPDLRGTDEQMPGIDEDAVNKVTSQEMNTADSARPVDVRQQERPAGLGQQRPTGLGQQERGVRS
jgi:hypothetical protein